MKRFIPFLSLVCLLITSPLYAAFNGNEFDNIIMTNLNWNFPAKKNSFSQELSQDLFATPSLNELIIDNAEKTDVNSIGLIHSTEPVLKNDVQPELIVVNHSIDAINIDEEIYTDWYNIVWSSIDWHKDHYFADEQSFIADHYHNNSWKQNYNDEAKILFNFSEQNKEKDIAVSLKNYVEKKFIPGLQVLSFIEKTEVNLSKY